MSRLGTAAAVAGGLATVIGVVMLGLANRPMLAAEPHRAAEPMTSFPAGSERAVAACRSALGAQDEEPIDRPVVLRVTPSDVLPGSWDVSGDTGVAARYYGGSFQSWNCGATATGKVYGFVFPG